jgi:hypothetical protein
MPGATGSLDLVVRDAEGLSLSATAAFSAEDRTLALRGVVIDPGWLGPASTRIDAAISADLIEAELADQGTFLASLEAQVGFEIAYSVEPRDLGDGYRLHDAQVITEFGTFRAFAIDDVVWFVPIGIGIGVVALVAWRTHRREEKAVAEANRKWDDCLASGGEPEIEYAVDDEVSGDLTGKIRIGSRFGVRIRCHRPRAGR